MAVGMFHNPIAETVTVSEGWARPSDWIDISSVGNNEINLLVHDGGLAAAFKVTTSSGTYSIDWGDGTVETGRASATVYQHSYTVGAGTPCSEGYTTFKIRIYGATGTITKFEVERHNLSVGKQYSPILDVNFGTTGLTSLASAFYCTTGNAVSCYNLRHCKLPTLASCSSVSATFRDNTALLQVDLPASWGAVTDASQMFYGDTNLMWVNLPSSWGEITNVSSMFNTCPNLLPPTLPSSWGKITNLSNFLVWSGRDWLSLTLPSSWGLITNLSYAFGGIQATSLTLPSSWGSVTNVSSMLTSAPNLKTLTLPATSGNITSAGNFISNCAILDTVTNIEYLGSTSSACDMNTFLSGAELVTSLSIGSLLSKIGVQGTSSVKNKLSSFRLTNASSTFGGSSPQVDVSYTDLSATALNTLFGDLPTLTGKTIKITGSTGAATCDTTIATAKGWTVTN